MPLDAPYRVERSQRPTAGYTHLSQFAIMSSSDGVLCYLNDQVMAYKIIDLLNEDARRGDQQRDLLQKPGSKRRVDAV